MAMGSRIVLYALALVFGLASGPWSLGTTSQSQPPIVWAAIPFAFIGCVISLVFVIGFQMMVGNYRAARFFSYLFRGAGIYFAAAGVTAALWSVVAADGAVPHAFMFLAVGLGTTVGVTVCRLLFASKWSAI